MEAFVYNNTPLPNQAADYLTQWIQENGLRPGDKLPTEMELAQKLNLGRSTVREAITILKSRNIVEVRRGCGTFLCDDPGAMPDPLGLNFVQDRAKLAMDWGMVRLIIEPAIAELAAINATEEDVEQLRYWNNQVDEDIKNNIPHYESDAKFHQALAAATKNIVIQKLNPIICEGIQQFMSVTNNSRVGRVLHREIIEAVAAHDAAKAKEKMAVLLCLNQDALRQQKEK